ncbi:MAG TPA: hypothetical protein VNH11_15365 [Pirellulales bacterium]|nr:hypothetical protein [Pirellulales bacterium]
MMLRDNLAQAILPIVLFTVRLSAADEVRDVVDPGGQQWREVHRTVRYPVSETQCVDQQQTSYQEHYDVQVCDTYRTYYAPVTEYRWESYWVNRFNPFAQPYLAQRLVPRTFLEARTEVVKVPVTQRNLVPVTRTVRVPVTTQRLVDHDVLVSRQLVSSQAPTVAANPAPALTSSTSSLEVGGVRQLDANRPRNIARVPNGAGVKAASVPPVNSDRR